jgi:hypothetical protein
VSHDLTLFFLASFVTAYDCSSCEHAFAAEVA